MYVIILKVTVVAMVVHLKAFNQTNVVHRQISKSMKKHALETNVNLAKRIY